MQRRLLLPIVLIGALAVALQLILPPVMEDRAEERLTEHGGTADVEVAAFPSLRLLWKDGDELRVRGRGYEFPLTEPEVDVFEEIDGFDEVDVDLSDFRVGPFEVERLRLRRSEGEEAYEMELAASAAARDLSQYAGGELGGALGSFLGGLAGGAVPGGDEQIPVDVDATLRSEHGGIEATDVRGSVLGLPAGPLAEALVSAIAARL